MASDDDIEEEAVLHNATSSSMFLSRHSDFTLPVSNVRRGSPPLEMLSSSPPTDPPRRTIFTDKVQHKYDVAERGLPKLTINQDESAHDDGILYDPNIPSVIPVISNNTNATNCSSIAHNNNHHHHLVTTNGTETPHSQLLMSPITPFTQHRRKAVHETRHAQSLLIGIAFCAVWSPSNCMAPNLTQMANAFGFQNTQERDLYLGSYCALATGVLSLPIAAGIGILADMQSRQKLFCITVFLGGVSAILTGLATEYYQLLIARLLNGGFMSGSVPVAFSFLGDLFHVHERNAASSGLTAMMGLGIIIGQVYAGMMGTKYGWSHAFYVSGTWTIFFAMACAIAVHEPVRGGTEHVLQAMLQTGTRYERVLTWQGFVHAMRHNKSNGILLWQGFFSSLPWGMVFVFLNDYLSQEKGFSVPDATFLVLIFGVGCAIGGILGGYLGQHVQSYNRSYLPLFMAVTTAAGILPFLGLFNISFRNVHGTVAIALSLSAGLVASLPSVNVRPCLINVNPPETRGVSLTAANLLINLGRGIGPSCVTSMGSIWKFNRQTSFNITMIVFWIISAMQLLFLARTLPKDQDNMEAELAQYAQAAMNNRKDIEESESLISIEERMTAFDSVAARETLDYVRQGFQELRAEVVSGSFFHCNDPETSDEDDEKVDQEDIFRRRDLWLRQLERDENSHRLPEDNAIRPSESTPLIE